MAFRLAALAALLGSMAPAMAADWQVIRANEQARLSIDRGSVKRTGDEVAFRFLIDLRKGEGANRASPGHRSIVTSARVRCKARTIAILDSEGFLGNGGQGVAISRSPPRRGEPAFVNLEEGTSDEDLWRHFCDPKATPAKAPTGKADARK